jgi:hypothetical protein
VTRNFLVLNPQALGGTFVVQDKNWTKYNSLQLELRRRLAQGLLVGANYTYGIKKASSLQSLRIPRIEVDASDDRNSPHVFKGNWTYELPFGRGRRFGGNMNTVLDTIVGNWEFSGNGRSRPIATGWSASSWRACPRTTSTSCSRSASRRTRRE